MPKTFCPAKWDELMINFNYNYVYSCCKATPIQFDKTYTHIIKLQQKNLLSGVQDSSCNFCWDLENKNLPSRRHHYLKRFDNNTFDTYTENKIPKLLEINIGNECNFQCLYCNPKFSSKWQADVTKSPYRLFSSKSNYELHIKFQNKKNNIETILNLLEETQVETVDIMGGEPFYNKNFYKILDHIKSTNLKISTNLSCDISMLEEFFNKTKKFNRVQFNISLDASKEISEFVRFGMNYDKLFENINWLEKNKPKNLIIAFSTLLTSVTVKDLKNFKNIIIPYLERNKEINWYLFHCTHPEFQSFSTLKENEKSQILDVLTDLEHNKQIIFANVIKSAILSSKFNQTLFKQLEIFVEEFASRKKIKIPFTL